MTFFSVLVVTLIATSAQAQVQKVDLKKDLPATGVVDLYQNQKGSKKKLSVLSQLKDYEIHLKWSECANAAPQVFASKKELRGWVAATWLHCLRQEVKKTNNVALLEKSLEVLESHPELFIEGPWSVSVSSDWLDLRLMQLEDQVQKKE